MGPIDPVKKEAAMKTTLNEVMADVRRTLTDQSNIISSWGYQERNSSDTKRNERGMALRKVEHALDEARLILFELQD